jgi:hypothetical protein
MLDILLQLGACMNWLHPLWTMIQNVRNGPHHTFYVQYGQGWSGRECEKLLKRAGIQCWGRIVFHNEIMLTVRKPQAERGEKILVDAGVPLLNRLRPTGRFTAPGWMRLFRLS